MARSRDSSDAYDRNRRGSEGDWSVQQGDCHGQSGFHGRAGSPGSENRRAGGPHDGGTDRAGLCQFEGGVEAAGVSLGNVVKTTVYLADMADFAQMNEV